MVEAAVEKHGDGSRDELGQFCAFVEHELGNQLRAALLVGHEFAGVHVVVDLGDGDPEAIRNLGECQQRFTAQKRVDVVGVSVVL